MQFKDIAYVIIATCFGLVAGFFVIFELSWSEIDTLRLQATSEKGLLDTETANITELVAEEETDQPDPEPAVPTQQVLLDSLLKNGKWLPHIKSEIKTKKKHEKFVTSDNCLMKLILASLTRATTM